MKKTAIALIIYFVGEICGYAQIAYYDALKLNSYLLNGKFNPDKKNQVDSILSKYVYDPFGTPTTTFEKNHFISEYFMRGTPHNLISGLPGTVLSSVGGMDVSKIADGLAKFLVKRTKEELSVSFFTKFKETLNKPELADLRSLFPNTTELLNAIGDEIYEYNKYIQNLREAFQEDIKTLDINFPQVIPNHKEFFNSHFDIAVSLKTACFITRELKAGVHPGDIIDIYPLDYFRKTESGPYFNKDWSGAIQTLQLINESLRDPSGKDGKYWISGTELSALVNNSDAFKIYLGLVEQAATSTRYDSIQFIKGKLSDFMDKIDFKTDYPALKTYISTYVNKVNELSALLKKYSKPANDSAAVEQYGRYFTSSVQLLEYSAKVSELPHFKDIFKVSLDTVFKQYFKISYETSGLVIDINRKNYSSAVNHAVLIYNLIRTNVLEKETNAKLKSAPLAPETASMKDSLQCSEEILSKLIRYGAFISAVSTAKNSDEVEQAIECAALPSGSSRIKRETPFNVSLNAFTGLFAGHETISGVSDKHVINNYGLAAPVGVAISTGCHHWSYSVFISLVDIGAVASFRFQNNDNVAQVPMIELKDIFSPGLFFSLGFPKCPLSFNLGAQVGPNLRSVGVSDGNGNLVNQYQNNVYWRYSASLVVDIPIFNFYTKSKR